MVGLERQLQSNSPSEASPVSDPFGPNWFLITLDKRGSPARQCQVNWSNNGVTVPVGSANYGHRARGFVTGNFLRAQASAAWAGKQVRIDRDGREFGSEDKRETIPGFPTALCPEDGSGGNVDRSSGRQIADGHASLCTGKGHPHSRAVDRLIAIQVPGVLGKEPFFRCVNIASAKVTDRILSPLAENRKSLRKILVFHRLVPGWDCLDPSCVVQFLSIRRRRTESSVVQLREIPPDTFLHTGSADQRIRRGHQLWPRPALVALLFDAMNGRKPVHLFFHVRIFCRTSP